MRCPYCGGINSDQAEYCVHCGRYMRDVPPRSPYQPASRQQPPGQPPRQAPPTQGRPTPQQPPRQAPPTQGRPGAAIPQQPPYQPPRQAPVMQPSPPPPAPEPPAPFPSRTVAQLQALEEGALPYTVANSAIGDGQKKIVWIVYPKCVPWQQVATLLKAFKEQQEERFNTVIIQGVSPQDSNAYSFTNGQLCFDRNVRLGGQTTNRYQIETGNGFESDSVRMVLTE